MQLTFEFVQKHQNISFFDVDNHLINALQNLGIDCDEKIHLIDFTNEIISQIELLGLDRYKQSISISFDEYTLSSDYIQNNISGFAFGSLYFLLDNYEKLNELINDTEICNSDEAREKLISKFFGSEFDNLSSEYSIRNLIYEIAGGIQLAIDIYKDEHGLNIVPDTDASSNEATLEPIDLIYSLPEIQAHTFLDAHDSIDLKNQYICSLALCFEERSELNKSSIEFIEAILEKYNLSKLEENSFFEIIENRLQRNNYIRNIPALLDNDNKKYTWLLDAFFLLTVTGRPIETSNIKTIINTLKPTQLQKLFSSMRTVVSGEESSKILEASLNLSEYTSAWKNIIRYRNLNFYDHFLDVCNKLEFITLKQDITSDLFDVYMKGMEHATFFAMSDFDDGFFSKLNDKAAATVCSQGRKSALSELNKIKKKTKDFITEHRFELSQANRIISDWKMKGFDFENSIQEKDFDLDNSAENENWGEYFEKYHRQIEITITSFIQSCNDALDQIKFFTKGDFDSSVAKTKEENQHARIRQQELEKLAKQSVSIIKNGQEQLFGIEWKQINNLPFDPNQISEIKTDGIVWIAIEKPSWDKKIFYRSQNGSDWEKIEIDQPEIEVWPEEIQIENNTWIIKNGASTNSREDGFYYSTNAINWQHTSKPKTSKSLSYKNIIYFNGLWLWHTTQYTDYSYIEKGIFFDSTKSSSYNETVILCAKTLAGPWEVWDKTPTTAEGIEIDAIYTIPDQNSLLAFCKYNSSYIMNKKKPDEPPFLMRYGASKTWKDCTLNKKSIRGFSSSNHPISIKIKEKFYIFTNPSVFGIFLNSNDGYEWKSQDIDTTFEKITQIEDLIILTSSSKIYVTQDGISFHEVCSDDGIWDHITANKHGVLGVYSANRHEETILKFGSYRYQNKDSNQ